MLERHESRIPIAKVKDHDLYLDELESVRPKGMSSEDSALFADNFIQKWATQILLLEKAEMNLSDDQMDVNRQVEEYRRSLLIYGYQKLMVRQLLDTSITDDEIKRYYDNNKQNFELQDNIARAILIKVDRKTKHLERIKKLCTSEKKDKKQELEEYCVQHAMSFHLNDQQWVSLSQLLGSLPETGYLNVNYFVNYKFAQVEDSTAIYMLYVKEIKYKDSVSPLEFERHNIKSILINQRKLQLMKKLEKDIFNEAVSKNQFKIISH